MLNSIQIMEDGSLHWLVFILAFPFLFLAMWLFVLAISSRASGWRQLSKLYPYQGQDALAWQHRGGGGVYRAKLPFSGMRGRLGVGTTRTGIIIKPPFVLRPFHPKLFLPFDRIVREEDRKVFVLDFVIIEMQGAPDLRVGILKSARDMANKVHAPAIA